VSVIVRFRNEAAYLPDVLAAIRAQETNQDIELLGVDDGSSDGSAAIARTFCNTVVGVSSYRPGAALNAAISESRGSVVAVLSAHALPANRRWLSHLTEPLSDANCLAAYGAQLYNWNSRFLDKRDLDIFTTDLPRREYRDSDFWNANSCFRRNVWERLPFNEKVFELEDHYWTKQLLGSENYVRFVPEALVYHYSHIDRLDREFLPENVPPNDDSIRAAVAILDDRSSDWPAVMSAGLTLSSLSRCSTITDAVPSLGNQLLHHWDFDVRWRMAQALGKITTPESATALVRALSDRSFYPRDEAAWSLGRLRHHAVPALLTEAHSPTLPDDSRPFLGLALGLTQNRRAIECGTELLQHDLLSDDPTLQRNSAYFLGELASSFGTNVTIPRLLELLDESEDVARVACWALGCFAAAGQTTIDQPVIVQLLSRAISPLTKYEAVVATAKQYAVTRGDWEARQLLCSLSDPEPRVRYAAAQSLRLLGGIGIPQPLPPIDEDFGVTFETRLFASSL